MKRKVNPEIFGLLTILFTAEKRIARKTRRDFVAGRITSTTFALKRIAQNKAFDRRYFDIYRKFA